MRFACYVHLIPQFYVATEYQSNFFRLNILESLILEGVFTFFILRTMIDSAPGPVTFYPPP